ncbi:MAG: hypothetical protein ACKOQ5_03100, partial [Solirubrobacterales bacterium]
MAPATDRKEPDRKGLEAFVVADPRLEAVRNAAEAVPVYLVGGSVRNLLLGREPTDIDIAIEGDLGPVLEALGGNLVEHTRCMT